MAINRKLIIAKPSVCGNRACARGGFAPEFGYLSSRGFESVRGRSFAPNEARKADAVFADDIPMKVSASARQKLDSNSSANSFGGGPGERIGE